TTHTKMKKIIQIFAMVALFIGATLNTTAQTPDWNTNGNDVSSGEWFGADPNSSEPVSFEHRADVDESRFEWHTTDGALMEVMRLERNGYLGVGTHQPRSRITVAP